MRIYYYIEKLNINRKLKKNLCTILLRHNFLFECRGKNVQGREILCIDTKIYCMYLIGIPTTFKRSWNIQMKSVRSEKVHGAELRNTFLRQYSKLVSSASALSNLKKKIYMLNWLFRSLLDFSLLDKEVLKSLQELTIITMNHRQKIYIYEHYI